MHIEKINDNQIKCILSQRDLLARELDLSELAYGTEKARSLFHEMIEQAHDAFGFEAENTPLMVEAIPVSKESIVLIITRIDTPDELDTRFSRFSSMDTDDIVNEDNEFSNGADDILDLFRSSSKKDTHDTEELLLQDSDDEETKLQEIQDLSSHLAALARSCSQAHIDAVSEQSSQLTADKSDPAASDTDLNPVNLMRIYSFDNLDDLLELSRILHLVYNGVNSLYKDVSSSIYYLVVYQSHHTPSEFNKICNILSEYGQRIKGSHSREAYYMEHYNCIVSQTALQRLYLF